MQLVSYLPIVDVMINGQGPFHLILDTGSAMVVLRPAVAKALQLPPGAVPGTEFARSAKGVRTVGFGHIQNLQLGDATFRNLDAKLVDIPQDYLGPSIRIDGLLGLRLFDNLLLSIDYPGRQLILDPAGSLHAEEPHVMTAILQDAEHLVLTLSTGSGTLDCILDTGTSMGLFLLHEDAQNLRFSHGPIPASSTATPNGQLSMSVGRLADPLTLGGHHLPKQAAYIQPSSYPLISQSDLQPLFGKPYSLLGGQILKNFVVSIDQRACLVRFERN